MDKNKQRELAHWLKKRSQLAHRWLRLSMLLGIITGLLIIAQAWIVASLLHALIIEQTQRQQLISQFALLLGTIVLRTLFNLWREQVGFRCGQAVRKQIRQMVLDRLQLLGPAWIQGKPTGQWATLILEQIEDMQDFYARYLPQVFLAGIIPLMIFMVVFPVNWAAGLILLVTAPLIPLFMALVGLGAAEASRRNFLALGRLSANFLDRLRGLDTLRLFHRAKAETRNIENASEDFRKRTMEVLRMAFLSSAVLEFFASISIAIVAVYFGFSYLGELHFGSYGTPITLFAGFLVLILAPEFFQPLRDLGTFYHAKAQAIGAAESLVIFLTEERVSSTSEKPAQFHFSASAPISIHAQQLEILSPQGDVLAGPIDFNLYAGECVAVIGASGAGKSSLINALLGFLPYRGHLYINGVELNTLSPDSWHCHVSWIGQNPYLPGSTLRDTILLGMASCPEQQLQQVIKQAYVDEFLPLLPDGLDSQIGDDAMRLSVGQAQRIAVARALIRPSQLLLLDEPAASLDVDSEQKVMQALMQAAQMRTTLMVTHQLDKLAHYDRIWVMADGELVQQGQYQDLVKQPGPLQQLLASRDREM